jgi:hypothetical protein
MHVAAALLLAAWSMTSASAQPQILKRLLPQPKETVPALVCEDARDEIVPNRQMLQAMRNSFGKVSYETARNANPENCLYPIKFLKFGKMDLLITIANEPGELCNLCTSKVSAHFLRNRPGTPKVLGRHVNFARLGPGGDPGTSTPIEIGGSEGVAFEATTEYAGNTYKDLYLFVFDKFTLVPLQTDGRIPTGFNNEDHVEDKSALIEAAGTWKIDPRRPRELAIDYSIRRGDKVETSRVVWTRNGNRLVRSGNVPKVLLEEPEMKPGNRGGD